jgi:bisphosphoglycerate-independent phosphoglycerate mutase (AlkP superfamily)
MDEKSKNDIIKILTDKKRYDLVAIMMSIFEEMDSDFEYDSPEEPVEEYYERDSVDENISYSITPEGFHYLN